jgi:hypothetical protein
VRKLVAATGVAEGGAKVVSAGRQASGMFLPTLLCEYQRQMGERDAEVFVHTLRDWEVRGGDALVRKKLRGAVHLVWRHEDRQARTTWHCESRNLGLTCAGMEGHFAVR